MKILIAYYSRRGQNYVGGDIVDLKVGNTEVAAGMVQKLTGGDTFRIEAEISAWLKTVGLLTGAAAS